MSRRVTNEQYFNVVQIHDVKKEKCRNLYLVEWEGFPTREEYTWEPHSNLKNCVVFQKYLSEKRGKGTREKGTKQRGKKRKRESRGVIIKDIFKKTKRDSLSKDERFDLIRSQNYKCNLCLNPFGSSSFEIDHIIPLEQGGTNDLENLQGLCDSCHIFKTTILDRGVIARLLQAKIQNKKIGKITKITRPQILEECQMVYFNRNRNRIPFHADEMLNFCINTVDVYREMCKKEVKKRISDIMGISDIMRMNDDSKIDFKITDTTDTSDTKENHPPEPPNSETENTDSSGINNKYLNNLVTIIQRLSFMKFKSTKINMTKFVLTFTLVPDKKLESDMKMYDFLDDFFKEVYVNKHDTLEKTIGCVTILYEKAQNL